MKLAQGNSIGVEHSVWSEEPISKLNDITLGYKEKKHFLMYILNYIFGLTNKMYHKNFIFKKSFVNTKCSESCVGKKHFDLRQSIQILHTDP